MFGTLKENILNKLENTYSTNGEKEFKQNFYSFIKVIKENKNLKEFYEIYDLFKQVNFDDEAVAKEFVEESLKYMKTLNKSEIKALQNIMESTELQELNTNSIEYKLDQLVFNENLNLKDKATYKVKLVNQIFNKQTENTDPKKTFETLYTKINENVSKLDESETQILDLFVENDSQKIKDYYLGLINETTDLVDKKVIATENVEVAKKLLAVKVKLNDLKTATPTINEIEKIISLKESFA